MTIGCNGAALRLEENTLYWKRSLVILGMEASALRWNLFIPFVESIPLSCNPFQRAAVTSMRSIQNVDILIY